MEIINTQFEGVFILKPKIFSDDRGWFYESFNLKTFQSLNINGDFVQDNQSYSKKGTIRGLHMQLPPFTQSKLITVLEGNICDIIIDCRKNSKTYRQSFTINLSSTERQALFVPKGFLHGFSVLSDFAHILYKVDNYYSKNHEIGVKFNDQTLNLDWKTNLNDIITSQKDLDLYDFDSFLTKYSYE